MAAAKAAAEKAAAERALATGSPTNCTLAVDAFDVDAAGVGHFKVRDSCGKLNPLTVEYERARFIIPVSDRTSATFDFDLFAGPKPLSIRTADGRSFPPLTMRPWNQTGLTKAVIIWEGVADLELHAFENSAPVNSTSNVNRSNPRSLNEAMSRRVGFLSYYSARPSTAMNVSVYTIGSSVSVRSVEFRINLKVCDPTVGDTLARLVRYQNGALVKGPELVRIQRTACGPYTGQNIDSWAQRARPLDIQNSL